MQTPHSACASRQAASRSGDSPAHRPGTAVATSAPAQPLAVVRCALAIALVIASPVIAPRQLARSARARLVPFLSPEALQALNAFSLAAVSLARVLATAFWQRAAAGSAAARSRATSR